MEQGPLCWGLAGRAQEGPSMGLSPCVSPRSRPAAPPQRGGLVGGQVAELGRRGLHPQQLRGPRGLHPGGGVVLRQDGPQGRRAAAPGLRQRAGHLPHPRERDHQRRLLALHPRLGRGQGRAREALQDPQAGQRRLLHHHAGAVRHGAAAGAALRGARGRALLPPGRALSPRDPAPGRPLSQDEGRVGDPARVAAAAAEVGQRAVRGSVDGHLERHHQGGGEDAEAGHHVPRGLPGGGADHEAAAARQAGAALRRRLRGAHLHRHRVHEPGQLAGLPKGRGRAVPEAAPAGGHGCADRRGHGLHRADELHPPGPARRQHPRGRQPGVQDRRLRPRAPHRGQRVHGAPGCQVPHQVDGAGGRSLRPLHHQVRRLVLRHPAHRAGHQGPGALPRDEQPGGAGAGGARLPHGVPGRLPALAARRHGAVLAARARGAAHLRVPAGLPRGLLHGHRAPVPARGRAVTPPGTRLAAPRGGGQLRRLPPSAGVPLLGDVRDALELCTRAVAVGRGAELCHPPLLPQARHVPSLVAFASSF